MKLPTTSLVTMIAGLALALGITIPAFASGLVDGSGTPTVAAGRTVDGSAYLAGTTITVQGTIQGDLYCGGNTVTITGVVEGDVLCAANSITLGGQVRGDVRLAGNTITSTGAIDGSAAMAANTLTLGGGSRVGRDLTIAGNTVDLAGKVARDVRVEANSAVVSGSVGRDVDGDIAKLTVTPGATITGNVHYTSANDATIADGTVAGQVVRTPPPPQPERRGPTVGERIAWAVGSIVSFVVLSVIIALLLPRFVRTATGIPARELVKAGLFGLLVLVVGPPLIILAFVTIIGIPLALLLLVTYWLLLLLAGPLAAYVIGREILRGSVRHPVGIMAIGAAVLGVVVAIPYVGWLVGFVASCVGVGLVVLALRSQFDNRPARQEPVGPGYPAYAGYPGYPSEAPHDPTPPGPTPPPPSTPPTSPSPGTGGTGPSDEPAPPDSRPQP